jgi:hypothetical protein
LTGTEKGDEERVGKADVSQSEAREGSEKVGGREVGEVGKSPARQVVRRERESEL